MANDLINRPLQTASKHRDGDKDYRLYPDIKQNTRHLEHINRQLLGKPVSKEKSNHTVWQFTHNDVDKKRSTKANPVDKISLDSRVGKEMMYQYTHNRIFKKNKEHDNIRQKSITGTRDRMKPPSLAGSRFNLRLDLTKPSHYGSEMTLDSYGAPDDLSVPPPPTPEPLGDIGRLGDTDSLPSVITLPTSYVPQHMRNMDPTSDIVKHAQDVKDKRAATPLTPHSAVQDDKRYMYVFPNRKWAKLHDRSATTPGELPKKVKPNKLLRRWASPRSRGTSSRHTDGSLSVFSDHLSTMSSMDTKSSGTTIRLNLDGVIDDSTHTPLDRADFFCSTVTPYGKNRDKLPPIEKPVAYRLPSPRKKHTPTSGEYTYRSVSNGVKLKSSVNVPVVGKT